MTPLTPINKPVYQACAHSHSKLSVGGGKVITGGSAYHPVGGPYDTSVWLDGAPRSDKRVYPWESGYAFSFPITDMSVPASLEDFKNLLTWVSGRLDTGDRVHVGCVGGHGRTGLFLSALVSLRMPEVKDPVTYVRENYCHKAVESAEQLWWLEKNFGFISEAQPSKTHRPKKYPSSLWSDKLKDPNPNTYGFDSYSTYGWGQRDMRPKSSGASRLTKEQTKTVSLADHDGVLIHPTKSKMNLW